MPDDSSIEELRKRLYARAGGPKPRERRKLREDAFEVSQEWKPEEEAVPQAPEQLEPVPSVVYERKEMSRTVRKIFIASGIFFLAAIAVAAWLFFSGKSIISNENIDIQISGPVSVPGGEELNIQIEIVNRNPVPLILSDLIVEYPDGTKSPSNSEVDMPRTRETVGTIAPGEKVRKTIRAVLFGVEGTEQKMKIALEYQIEDSTALFKKDYEYAVLLSSAPVAIKVDALKEITPGQEVTLVAHVISNSSKVLGDVLLTVDYPFGFVPTATDPSPAYGANVWDLGDLSPLSERVITIKGTLTGQNTEERVFRFGVGSDSESKPGTLAALFQTEAVPVVIRRPFIHLAFDFESEKTLGGALVVGRGQRVSGSIRWANTLPATVNDLVVEMVLSGPTLDQRSISSANGFYRSIDNTIIWSSETEGELGVVEPGEEGVLAFTFGSRPFTLGSNISNPTLNLVARVKAKRLSERGVPETLESTISATAKVLAEPQVTSRLVYNLGPFQNTGPVPPRVDSETTYTVLMNVVNDINDLQNVTVVGRLPSYVKWLGVVSPQDANIKYNPNGGQFVWNIGPLPAGTGYNTPPAQVAFQISIVPSLSQVNSTPALVSEQRLSGVDQFTGSVIEVSSRSLTTDLQSDPNAPQNAGLVSH